MTNQDNTNKDKVGFKKHPHYKKKNKHRNGGKKHTDNQNPAEEAIELTVNSAIGEVSYDTPSEIIDKSQAQPHEACDADNSMDSSDITDTGIKAEMPEDERSAVAGIRFKSGGKVYYFDKNNLELKDGDYVIVDTARGEEFGEVAFAQRAVPTSSLVLPLRFVLRVATGDDKLHHEENKQKEKEAFGICLEKIQKHELDMKLIDVQYTFDNTKLLFYFTSAGRVDFRELVKDLASVFKTRIELRQIGIRDESKILGGLGACGRPLCCSTFLSDFAQVSIKMAKEQNLSLNTGKISGCCGRLMCCLQYEYPVYAEESAKTPPVDSIVKTPDGVGTVIEISPLVGNVKVRLSDHPDLMPKTYNRDEVKIISKPAAASDEK